MGAQDHKEHAVGVPVIRCSILVVSDTKTPETDTSGKLASDLFTKHDYTVIEHRFTRNDASRISGEIAELLKGEADVVLTIGGTGPGRKDVTVDAVRPFIAKELPGFGELFRTKSVSQIGTAAILSRALLGVTDRGKIIVSTPGSESAVKLALEEILLHELRHLVWDLRRT